MRDFPNMSYCAFENTAKAIDQCMGIIEAALEEGEPLELNTYEQRPFAAMYDKLQAFMTLLEQHQEMVEQLQESEAEAE